MDTLNSSPHPVSGGGLLAQYRKERGLTQHELAERIGGSRSMIAQIEGGERQPSGPLLVAISHALRLSQEQEALLFVGYNRLSPAPGRSLASIIALIQLDPDIPPVKRRLLLPSDAHYKTTTITFSMAAQRRP
jgi:transcriptional regulator with XRE-family HTH domain